ncbi:NUDIX domain-containing protein [Clostridium sp. MT-14]|uniref:NUDIX hydrolase n=1 Tax=Clostridium aromativorans TaxID=2836848 RepID=A0ABS8N5I5_9CLOT|nr:MULTISPECIES: NUDIX hydrolase [Clostridium]KAA8672997.1 NUDIX hydrolase [Clostridium sp. HV4-5-A1G]MCC9295062.1 NUDIX hydrolase [Clostridium aromativorans]CAB1250981.1 ADP-ribose pyrophosphatase [Clostridiaceae bacterium BL-3]
MRKLSDKTLYSGNWIKLEEITYEGKKHEQLKWESIERTNTTNTVVIISKMVPSNRYILIKQYRPTIDNYVIGFPAGLVESGSLPENALRELKEETGYTGNVKSVGISLYSNAALLTDKVRVVKVEIDENLEENKKPKQNLEAAEDIEVIALKKEEIKKFFLKEQARGIAVAMGPWYAFFGMENI